MTRFTFVRALVLSTLGTLALAGGAHAAPAITGPAPDFKGDVRPGSVYYIDGTSIGTKTTVYKVESPGSIHYYNTPQPGSTPVEVSDFAAPAVTNPSTNWAFVVGVSYVQYNDVTNGGDLLMTTIYGADNNPTLPGSTTLTGYSMTTPEVIMSNETIAGADGVNYPATSSQLMHISDLPALLGASTDLSPFQGDPAAGVWVFQTSIPFAATSVPEPAALGLLAIGAVLLRRRGRNRQGACGTAR